MDHFEKPKARFKLESGCVMCSGFNRLLQLPYKEESLYGDKQEDQLREFVFL